MKFIAPITSLTDISKLAQADFSEAIIGWSELARRSHFQTEAQVLAAIESCREHGLTPVLLWDILMTESQWERRWNKFEKFMALLGMDKNKEPLIVRVLDAGVAEAIMQKKLSCKVQFILHNGGHNFEAIAGWSELLAPVLDRLVLSPELPLATLKEYQARASSLNFNLEVTLLAPLLLFYTPRPLLPHQHSQTQAQEALYQADSEETHHRGFEVRANQHGTLMYHHKDFSILDEVQDLARSGLSAGLVDWTQGPSELLFTVKKMLTGEMSYEEFKLLYPRPVFRGYALNNRSDVLFPKLKNARLQSRHQNYIGEVLHLEKGSGLGVRLKRHSLKPGDRLEFVSPDGKKKSTVLSWIKSIDGELRESAASGEFVVLPYVSGMTVKSQFFLLEPSHEVP
jgi:putative protease